MFHNLLLFDELFQQLIAVKLVAIAGDGEKWSGLNLDRVLMLVEFAVPQPDA